MIKQSPLKFLLVKSGEIRKRFVEFFKEKGHTHVPSSPLLPPDPTLLFTNAGMNQFKPYFLGETKPPFKRAVSVQKCLRAGGKHNDLDNVGFTRRHHTFFEMLGNFSFGDYFKREAILWAWELITEVFEIPEERIWITVYEEDDEAYNIWKDEVGVPKERILRMGTKDNFWEMGEVGPCGPSSEILYDLGEEADPNQKSPYDEGERWLELWNLVFMEFNKRANSTLEPLPNKNIDTGMGLERIAAVLQGTYSNYETDLFMPIIKFIEDVSGVKYTFEAGASHRVIADHTRALVFAISDGIFPSNFGRGYVLRRILRRAYRFAQKLNIAEPILYKVAEVVVDVMGGDYPEIKENFGTTQEVIKSEEERFLATLGKAIPVLMEHLESSRNKGILDGETAFNLYDTYGIPQDMIDDWATTYGLSVDWERFHKVMEKAREKSRAESKFMMLSPEWKDISGEYTGSKFVGYDKIRAISRVAKIGKVENYSTLVCFETPFYPEGGGQVGDVGEIKGKNWKFKVMDTKRVGSDIVHIGKAEGEIGVGDECILEVSETHRRAAMRAHTSTHLLHATLRSVLGTHVRQQGSLVERERLRFDFSHPKPLSNEEIAKIESVVNRKIRENIPVSADYKKYREALKEGAMAIFEEKYGDTVRVITIGDFSKELCGGTHVERTGDIGMFVIVKEESVAAGTRRIEALVGERALRYFQEQRQILMESAGILRTNPANLPSSISKKLDEIRRLMGSLEKAYEDLAKMYAERLKLLNFNGYTVKILNAPLPPNHLRRAGDRIFDTESIVILVSEHYDSRGFIHVRVGDKLTSKFSAKNIIKSITSKLGGGGGGGDKKAEGRVKDLSNFDIAIKEIFSS